MSQYSSSLMGICVSPQPIVDLLLWALLDRPLHKSYQMNMLETFFFLHFFILFTVLLTLSELCKSNIKLRFNSYNNF